MSDFNIPNIEDLDEQLHDLMYEWMEDQIKMFYGVDSLNELSDNDIQEVEDFANEHEAATGSLLANKLHSIIWDWHAGVIE